MVDYAIKQSKEKINEKAGCHLNLSYYDTVYIRVYSAGCGGISGSARADTA
jgi:hypothetical protein